MQGASRKSNPPACAAGGGPSESNPRAPGGNSQGRVLYFVLRGSPAVRARSIGLCPVFALVAAPSFFSEGQKQIPPKTSRVRALGGRATRVGAPDRHSHRAASEISEPCRKPRRWRSCTIKSLRVSSRTRASALRPRAPTPAR
jgi:hypothetical protein